MADAQDILSLCKRIGFLYPSYEIYGGVAGMYDYGPLGTALKNNIIEIWRRLYTLGEGFIEIDSETIGPEMVFKASGHVDEFADKMVKCKACEEPYRADHIVSDLHPNAGALSERRSKSSFARTTWYALRAEASCPTWKSSTSCSRPP